MSDLLKVEGKGMGRRVMPELPPCPECGKEPTAGQKTCRRCRALYKAAQRKYIVGVYERDQVRVGAQNRAAWALVRLHRDEYERLLKRELRAVKAGPTHG